MRATPGGEVGLRDLESFCEAEFPKLVGLLGLYCGDRYVAEDLAQETLARAWRHWNKVRGLDSPEAWARRVAINLANSHFRRILAERRAKHRMGGVERAAHPDEAETQALRDAVARLPKRQRTSIALHYFLDLPFAEVAIVMDVPEATAKSLARRGIARLQKQAWLGEAVDVT